MEMCYTPVVGWINRTVLQSAWKVEKEVAMRRRPENRVMDMHLIKVDNNLTNFDIVSGYGNVLHFPYRLVRLNY